MKLGSGEPASVGMSPSRVKNLAGLLRRWTSSGEQQAMVAVVARRMGRRARVRDT